MYKYLINLIIKLVMKDNFFKHLERLKKLQYVPKKELEVQQLEKLKIMLDHAYNNVPFYRKKFDEAGVKPEDLVVLRDLCRFPITTKQELRDDFPQGVSAITIPKKRFILNSTSGSTGMPFRFFMDKKASSAKFASFLLFNSWFGIELGDRILQISAHHNTSLYEKVINKVVLRKKHISIHDIKKEKIIYIVDEINKYKPALIESYASGLLLLAKYMREQNISFTFRPKLVITTSEELSEPNRKFAESVFGFNIIQRYGSKEFCGHLAQECREQKGMHLNTDLAYVEFVDNDRNPCPKGITGSVLVTDLNNFAMPFIRYNIGDLGKYVEECKCRRKFPLIEIEGRAIDIILSKKGEEISIREVSSLFLHEYPSYILQFQCVQKKFGDLAIKIVPSSNFNKKISNKLKNDINELLPCFNIKLKLVDEIPPEKNGKRKILISEIID